MESASFLPPSRRLTSTRCLVTSLLSPSNGDNSGLLEIIIISKYRNFDKRVNYVLIHPYQPPHHAHGHETSRHYRDSAECRVLYLCISQFVSLVFGSPKVYSAHWKQARKSKKCISLNIAILVGVKTDLVGARLSMEGSIIKN